MRNDDKLNGKGSGFYKKRSECNAETNDGPLP